MMTDQAQQEWPTHKDELSRKTLDELAKWTQWNAAGEKSDAAFLLAVGVMWDVTSGLINDDISHTLAAIHNDLRIQIKKSRNQR